jgi:hypothetical protein
MADRRHQPTDVTRAKVEALAAYGIPEEDIAREIGASPKTLRKYYRTEIDTAATRANARVGEFLFSMASGRNGPIARDKDGTVVRDANGNPIREIDFRSCTTAAIFWSKARMRWRQAIDINVNPEDDNADAARDKLARGIDRLAAARAAEPAAASVDA